MKKTFYGFMVVFFFLSTNLSVIAQDNKYLEIINQLPRKTLDDRILIEVSFPLLAAYFLKIHTQIRQKEYDTRIAEQGYKASESVFDPTLTYSLTREKTSIGSVTENQFSVTNGYHSIAKAALSALTERGIKYSLSYRVNSAKVENNRFQS